jgi:hypothetical protein
MSIFDFFKKAAKQNDAVNTIHWNLKEEIGRHIEILQESIDLVNYSNDILTVIRRYKILVKELTVLSGFTNEELSTSGFYPEAPFSESLCTITKNRDIYINQAIERNIEHSLNSLKTTKGKLDKLETLYHTLHDLPDLSKDNIIFLDKLYGAKKSKLSQSDVDAKTITSLPKKSFVRDYDPKSKFVELSTSGDENVCPMCAQFEGKIFLAKNAPSLPLCPDCGCAYIEYFKDDLPSDTVINDKNDFVLPAKCTSMFYNTQHQLYEERDINKRILLCENELKKLKTFMKPYLSAGFPSPCELACRDLLPDLYIQLGEWENAENTIKSCIAAGAYYPEDGSDQLSDFESYRKVATETLFYISQNPGCLQRNIYKHMGYDGKEKEILKHFLRNSQQIEKVKCNHTNQLFCKTAENTEY